MFTEGAPKKEPSQEFDTLLQDLRKTFLEKPELQPAILQVLNGLKAIVIPQGKEPSVNTPLIKETSSSGKTLEQALNVMYSSDNFDRLRAQPFTERMGTAGAGITNESFFGENLQIIPQPDGYIIGTGNGAIWSMLELFPAGTLPKGLISIEYDPSVVLEGKVVVELAKRGISRDEAMAYLYGDMIQKPGGNRWDIYTHKPEELVVIAREIALKEQNPKVRALFIDAIEKGKFVDDIKFMRQRHETEYKKPLFAEGNGALERKGGINISAIIYKHWGSISTLAQEGNIAFLYADIGNEEVLSLIDSRTPDIKNKRNIIYTSNVVDFRYRREVNGLQRFNPAGESSYVYTTQRPDDYILKTSHTPPKYQSPY